MSEFSPKQKSLAIVPKPFAILSLIGSSYIVYHILHNSKRRKAVQYQILLGLSLSDILFSIAVSWICYLCCDAVAKFGGLVVTVVRYAMGDKSTHHVLKF